MTFKNELDMEKDFRKHIKGYFSNSYIFPKIEIANEAMPDLIFFTRGGIFTTSSIKNLFAIEFKFLEKDEKEIPKTPRYCRQLQKLYGMQKAEISCAVITNKMYKNHIDLVDSITGGRILFKSEWNRIYGYKDKEKRL